MTPKPIARIACSLALITLAGCGGHGVYTTEGVSIAERKMAALKAAAEYEMAEQAFLAGDLDKAERTVALALALTPDVSKNHVLLGRVLLEQGRVGEALAAFNRAVALKPEHAEAHFFLGVVAERLRDPAAAVNHFIAAAEAEPLDPQFTVAAGEMLVDLDRLDEAEDFLSASEVYDHAPAVRQLLGHISMIRGLHDEAAQRFRHASLLAPGDAAIREDLATALVAAGEYAEGEHELVRLLGDQPEDADVRRDLLHLRGLCLIALARPLDARQVYRTLTDSEGGAGDIDAWVGLGRTAFLIGDMRSLRRAGERARAIDPSRPDGAVLLALHAREAADAEQALAELDRFNGEGTADLHTLRALILTDLGRVADAREALYAALDHTPGDRSAMHLLDQLPEAPLDTFATAPTE